VSSLYQAPGSLLGQAAGLGTGIYGLSQMGMKMAGGGAVHYENGGSVDHPDNVAAIVHRLSEQELAQAEQAARARGDVEELDAIEKEKAMRASERGGMAGAFNSLPDKQQQHMLAGGGMAVAFKNGGDEGEQTSMAGDLIRGITGPISDAFENLSKRQELRQQMEKNRPGLFEALSATEKSQRAEKSKEYLAELNKLVGNSSESKSTDKPVDKFTDPYKGPPTRRVDYEDKKPQISPVIKRGISELATSRGMSEDDLMESTKKMMAYFDSRSKPEMDKLQAMIDQGAGESKEIKEQALGRALAKYGFDWAAKASQPGARFLGSASAAAPSIAESVAESQKLEQAARQNQLKLNMSMQQFRIAQSKGDERAALAYAQQVRQLKQFDQQIELKRQELGIHAAGISQKNQQFNAMMGARMASAGAQNKQAQARLAKVGTDAAFKYDESNRRIKDGLIKQHGPDAGEALYSQGRKNYINEAMQSTSDSMLDSRGSEGSSARNVFDLLED